MASIEQFKGTANAKNGLARSNLYSVLLPSIAGVSSSDLNVLCSNVNLPGRQLQTYDKNIGTKFEKVAYGSVTEDVAMTFYTMNDYGIKKYFDAWQRLAYDPDAYQIGYKSNYSRQITINQLSRAASTSFDLFGLARRSSGVLGFVTPSITISKPEQVIYSCTLYEAFPLNIDAIPLSGELDGLVQVTAAFTYSKWLSNDLQGQPRTTATLNLDINLGNIITRIFD